MFDDEIQIALSNQNEAPESLLLDLLEQLIHRFLVGDDVFQGPLEVTVAAMCDCLHAGRGDNVLDVSVVDLLDLQETPVGQPFQNRIDKSILQLLVNFPRLRNPLNLLYSIKIYFKIRKFNPHIIHFQTGFLWFSFLLPLLKKWPLITTIHDDVPHTGDKFSKRMKWFFPNTLALQFSSKLIVHGENIKIGLLTQSGVPENKIVNIVHGDGFIYKNNYKKVYRTNNRILFFGRILAYKGLPYLIKAQPYISQEIPDIKICIAGEGDLLKKYEKLFVDKRCFEIYNHYINSDLMAKLFQNSSIVVLPYNEASQSGVVSIAYSFSKPVIATNVGCIPEIIDHEKTGLIVEPRDEKKLAAAIISLLKDKNKRRLMGKNAYKKVSTEMSWENVAQLTKDVYLNVLSKLSDSNKGSMNNSIK